MEYYEPDIVVICDEEKQIVSVYLPEQSEAPMVYRFGAVIAVGLYPDLQIDTTPLEEINYRD